MMMKLHSIAQYITYHIAHSLRTISIISVGLSVVCIGTSCSEPEKLPRVETTEHGYEILHLTPKDTALFADIDPNTITVEYYFAWGCPHCNAFYPALDKWIRTSPQYPQVAFGRTPVSLLPEWIDASRLYYVSQDMGFFAAVDKPMYHGFHGQPAPLESWIEDIASYALSYAQAAEPGITKEQLIDRMESDKVEQQILADNNRVIALMLRTTPTIIVHSQGKIYRINNATARPKGGIINVLDTLIGALHT